MTLKEILGKIGHDENLNAQMVKTNCIRRCDQTVKVIADISKSLPVIKDCDVVAKIKEISEIGKDMIELLTIERSISYRSILLVDAFTMIANKELEHLIMHLITMGTGQSELLDRVNKAKNKIIN